MASRYQAAVTRLRKFEAAGPPEVAPRDQNINMRLRGGRTGRRAIICEDLELTGLMRPFDAEIWYGERVAVLGSNGSGKSHFLRLLMSVADDLPRGAIPAEPVAHSGLARLGARVSPGLFAQTHARPDLAGRTPCEIVMTEHARLRNEAMNALARYELAFCGEQPFETLSGGQQARLQILLLELGGATLLLLDEPTDNLDVASAEALQEGLEIYQGTVWLSPTIAGSPARSTASWSSGRTPRSTNHPTRCGMRPRWAALGLSAAIAATRRPRDRRNVRSGGRNGHRRPPRLQPNTVYLGNIRVATHFSKGTMSSVLDRTASSSSQAPQQLADAAPSAGGRTSRRATHRRGGWITLRFVELSITL